MDARAPDPQTAGCSACPADLAARGLRITFGDSVSAGQTHVGEPEQGVCSLFSHVNCTPKPNRLPSVSALYGRAVIESLVFCSPVSGSL